MKDVYVVRFWHTGAQLYTICTAIWTGKAFCAAYLRILRRSCVHFSRADFCHSCREIMLATTLLHSPF